MGDINILVFYPFYMIASIIQFPPVKCNISGCNGRMELMRTRVSLIEVNLYYYCKKCGETYETDIISLLGSGHGGGK